MKKASNLVLLVLFAIGLMVSCKNNESKSMVLEETQEPPKTVFAENVQVANERIVVSATGILVKKVPLTAAGTSIDYLITVNVKQEETIHLQEGDIAEVNLKEQSEKVYQGAVERIAPIINREDMLALGIKLTVDKERPLAGEQVDVTITSQDEIPLMRIPIQALASKEGKKGKVYLFGEGTVSPTEVLIFKEEKEFILISGGLSKGDQVVIVDDSFVPDEETVSNK